jgi:hypothetical protein
VASFFLALADMNCPGALAGVIEQEKEMALAENARARGSILAKARK